MLAEGIRPESPVIWTHRLRQKLQAMVARFRFVLCIGTSPMASIREKKKDDGDWQRFSGKGGAGVAF